MTNRNHRTPDHDIARLRAETELLAAQVAAMRTGVTQLADGIKILATEISEIDDVVALLERHCAQLVEKLTKP